MGCESGGWPPQSTLAFGFGGDVAFGEFGAFAEEELLHLFFHDFLGIGIERIEAVFVHQHFGMLDPELPGIFRNAFKDALAELAFPGRAVEAGELAAEFNAVHHAGAGLGRLVGGRRVPARIIGHSCPSLSTFLTIPQALGNS